MGIRGTSRNFVTAYTKAGILHLGISEWTRTFRKIIPHRNDGPALEFASGVKKWFQNGELHRIDGPAIIYPNGDDEWYINGKILNKFVIREWLMENEINLQTDEGRMAFILRWA